MVTLHNVRYWSGPALQPTDNRTTNRLSPIECNTINMPALCCGTSWPPKPTPRAEDTGYHSAYQLPNLVKYHLGHAKRNERAQSAGIPEKTPFHKGQLSRDASGTATGLRSRRGGPLWALFPNGWAVNTLKYNYLCSGLILSNLVLVRVWIDGVFSIKGSNGRVLFECFRLVHGNISKTVVIPLEVNVRVLKMPIRPCWIRYRWDFVAQCKEPLICRDVHGALSLLLFLNKVG